MTERAAGREGTKRRQGQREPDNYEELINSLGAIVWERDAATLRFTFVGGQAERLLGYPSEQWLRDPHFWADHVHAEDRACLLAMRAAGTAGHRHDELEYRMVAADGRVV